jgi:hypothetical protein
MVGEAGQEHRQRVFLIFLLEIPFPTGFPAQEALVISSLRLMRMRVLLGGIST